MSYTANITASTTFMCRRVSLTVDNTEVPREGLLQAKGFQSHSLLVGPRGDPPAIVLVFLNCPPDESTPEVQAWPSRAQPS